jgi:hypothetical protein
LGDECSHFTHKRLSPARKKPDIRYCSLVSCPGNMFHFHLLVLRVSGRFLGKVGMLIRWNDIFWCPSINSVPYGNPKSFLLLPDSNKYPSVKWVALFCPYCRKNKGGRLVLKI